MSTSCSSFSKTVFLSPDFHLHYNTTANSIQQYNVKGRHTFIVKTFLAWILSTYLISISIQKNGARSWTSDIPSFVFHEGSLFMFTFSWHDMSFQVKICVMIAPVFLAVWCGRPFCGNLSFHYLLPLLCIYDHDHHHIIIISQEQTNNETFSFRQQTIVSQ